MTLGLVTGLVGAAVGTAAGVAGAALNVGSQVIETAVNITDTVCLELARFALAEQCKVVGPTLRLKGLVSGTVTVGPDGKTYRLTLQVEVLINGLWISKTVVAQIFVPWVGLPSLSAYEYIETNV